MVKLQIPFLEGLFESISRSFQLVDFFLMPFNLETNRLWHNSISSILYWGVRSFPSVPTVDFFLTKVDFGTGKYVSTKFTLDRGNPTKLEQYQIIVTQLVYKWNEIFLVHNSWCKSHCQLSEYINMTNYNCAKCQNCS